MKLDQRTMGYITIFEKITRARVKDILEDNGLLFIVKEGDIGKAIGKQGKNIRRVGHLLKKKIKIIEFNSSPERFIENLISPIKSKIYKEGENSIIIEPNSRQDKAYILGKNKRNLVKLQDIIKEYFGFEVMVK